MKALPCIINVGLCADSDDDENPNQRFANEAKRLALWYENCRLAGATRISLHHSNTEPTLVATFPQHYHRPWLAQLTAKTQQRCIAVYYPTTRQGELIGSGAKGLTFLREFFVLFDGSRLEDNPGL